MIEGSKRRIGQDDLHSLRTRDRIKCDDTVDESDVVESGECGKSEDGTHNTCSIAWAVGGDGISHDACVVEIASWGI
ncbi:MAG: hypothetical protein IPL91_15990 [Hyphomicrobium sp.]|nr:hypothetical protein [Hyphomicrobium sp.]